ncbi:hypothetical protein T439DRAFT_247183 [Meredithblackwellia eburnea MCA 4105]
MSSATSRVIPAYKKKILRLPPAKPSIFKATVLHPPAPYAAPPAGSASASTSQQTGPSHTIYTTSPRNLIPLTTSPLNHRLWNPPAPDAKGSRIVEKDESGRLARFGSRWGAGDLEVGEGAGQFGLEGDLSFLEGETLQSPNKPLGKRDIVGAPKATKKGKK